MTTTDERPGTTVSRFGAAAPGAAPVAVPAVVEEPPTRSRRRRWLWPLAAVAVVVLAGGGYLGGRLTSPRQGPLVVTVTRGLAAGSPVTAGELRLTHMTDPPPGAVRLLVAATGRTALRGVPVGAVVTPSDIGPAVAYPGKGDVLVGVAVKPGQEPAEGLQPGDIVTAVEQPPSQNGKPVRPVVLALGVTVTATAPFQGGEAVSLVVPGASSVALGTQSASGNVSLIKSSTSR